MLNWFNKSKSGSVEIKSLSLPAAAPRWSLFARGQNKWLTQAAIDSGYNESAIVYACVEKRAQLIASVPMRVMRKTNDGYEADPASELQLLLDRPNPAQSGYELLYSVSQQLDLSGNAYISEIKAGISGTAKQLWVLPAQHMKAKAGRVELVELYEYQSGGGKTEISPNDLIHIRKPNPDDPIFGMPVLKAAARAIDIDRESAIWQNVSLQNRGASDINIKLPSETSPQQLDELRKAYKEKQAGANNARSVMITTGDIQQLGQTAVEMDFVNSRRAAWSEICAAFGMSLANLGMTEAVNLANARAMDRSLWQQTIIPQLELIVRALNHGLTAEFGAEYKIEYDLSNVEALQDEQSTKLLSAQQLFAMGVPFNELNKRFDLGFNEVDGGNIGYLNSGLLPVGFEVEPIGDTTEAEKAAIKNNAYGQ